MGYVGRVGQFLVGAIDSAERNTFKGFIAIGNNFNLQFEYSY
jgi:hypothetical protein